MKQRCNHGDDTQALKLIIIILHVLKLLVKDINHYNILNHEFTIDTHEMKTFENTSNVVQK